MDEKSNPIARLFGSSKALIVMAVLVAAFIALFLGKATWEQMDQLVRWTVGPWLLAVGAEDAARHISQGRVDVEKLRGATVVETAKVGSIVPPAMPPEAGK